MTYIEYRALYHRHFLKQAGIRIQYKGPVWKVIVDLLQKSYCRMDYQCCSEFDQKNELRSPFKDIPQDIYRAITSCRSRLIRYDFSPRKVDISVKLSVTQPSSSGRILTYFEGVC